MATSAIDSGRARNLLQQAQGLAAELRSMPMDPETTRGSYPRLFDLVCLVRRFVDAAAAMPADDPMRAMWEQRGAWLQEEVAALAEERVHSPDKKQYWLNLVLLLFAGAETCDAVQREKVELEAERDRQAQHILQQDDMLREAAVRLRDAAAAAEQQAIAQAGIPTDVELELRTRCEVLQGELRHREDDAQRRQQEAQALASERDTLQQQLYELRSELAKLRERCDSQVEVIQAMMAKSEASSRQSTSVFQDNIKLVEDNKALGASFETNAKVIEKLIELNSELMDSMNQAAAARQQQQQQQGRSTSAIDPHAAAATASSLAAHHPATSYAPDGRSGHRTEESNGHERHQPAPLQPPQSRSAMFGTPQPATATYAAPAPTVPPAAPAGRSAPAVQPPPGVSLVPPIKPSFHGTWNTRSAIANTPSSLTPSTPSAAAHNTPPLPLPMPPSRPYANGNGGGGAPTPPLASGIPATPPPPPPAPSFTDAFAAFINSPDPVSHGGGASSPPPPQPSSSSQVHVPGSSATAYAAGRSDATVPPAGPSHQPAAPSARRGILTGAAGVMRYIAGSDAAASAAAAATAGGTAAAAGGAAGRTAVVSGSRSAGGAAG